MFRVFLLYGFLNILYKRVYNRHKLILIITLETSGYYNSGDRPHRCCVKRLLRGISCVRRARRLDESIFIGVSCTYPLNSTCSSGEIWSPCNNDFFGPQQSAPPPPNGITIGSSVFAGLTDVKTHTNKQSKTDTETHTGYTA